MRIIFIWYLENGREWNDLRPLILQVYALGNTWVWFTCKLSHLLISPPFAGQYWSVKIIWLGLWLFCGAGSLGSCSTAQCILKGAFSSTDKSTATSDGLLSSSHHFISVPSMFRWKEKMKMLCSRTHVHFGLELSLLVPSFHFSFKHVFS